MFIEFTRPIINPCPKCGKSGGQLYPTLNGGKIRVECPECGFCSSTPGRDFREAIQIWNKTALVKKVSMRKK